MSKPNFMAILPIVVKTLDSKLKYSAYGNNRGKFGEHQSHNYLFTGDHKYLCEMSWRQTDTVILQALLVKHNTLSAHI